MMIGDSETLTALLFVAGGAGVTHTLVGPDHFLPLVAAGKARHWSARKLAGVTAVIGLTHCLASVVLVIAVILFSAAASPVWLDGMAQLAAWTMIAAGMVFAIGAWRRRRLPATSTCPATIRPASKRPASKGPASTRPAITLVAIAFLVGPCEWLIPVALAAGKSHGLSGAITVAAVYTFCTITTMVAAALVVGFGLRRMHHHEWLAPVTCTVCGVLMLTGL